MARSIIRALIVILVCLTLLISFPVGLSARGGSHAGGYSTHSSSSSGHHYKSPGASRSSTKCESCPRDSHGRIKRDPKAVEDFKKTHPKPPGCKDCEVDHIAPLSKGGRDDPSNMQWLPKKEHQDKTKRDLQRP
jgi:hypothetical protein